jgi:glycosyltransferase involved in cell wall biosynthesis
MKPVVTVFTATYNRAHTLPLLYKSLQEQPNTNFEWVIVDDGSTDNTEELVNSWANSGHNSFKIVYRRTSNRGKHCAINLGAKLAKTDLFFIADSDDIVCKNAINNIIRMNDTLNDNEREHFAGISGSVIFDLAQKDEEQRDQFSFIDATNLERQKYGLEADKSEVYFTHILREYPFPSFKGEKFLSECVIWDKIARDGYLIRWFNIPLLKREYLEDGLSKNLNKHNIKSPKGFALQILNDVQKSKNPLTNLKKYYSYYSLLHGRLSDREIRANLKINQLQVFLLKLISFIKKPSC